MDRSEKLVLTRVSGVSCARCVHAVHAKMMGFWSMDWGFTKYVPADRVERLRSSRSFDEIFARIVPAPIERFCWEKGARLLGWTRASFDVRVPEEVYDAFFNSPQGLRGQYATNESTGRKANRKACDALEPALLEYAKPRAPVDLGLVRASLRGVDAKIWIATSPETNDQLTAPHASIEYELWERNEPDGEGLRAPVGTILVVTGAWLDADGNEVRDGQKKGRDTLIYEKGRPN